MKPILFNTDMVRALLEGRKTVTRRVVKGYSLEHLEIDADGSIIGVYDQHEGCVRPVMDFAPYQPCDILYVRETWKVYEVGNPPPHCVIEYKAGGMENFSKIIALPTVKGEWRPSIHMPKDAARLFLRVTDVRVERLQDMRLIDCMKEGVQLTLAEQGDLCIQGVRARDRFSGVWDSTIKPADLPLYGWEANPWVWVIEFERVSKEAEGAMKEADHA